MQRAYELNFPMLATVTTAHRGALPSRHSFVQIEPGNVILTVLKKAEDEDALIFRYYEFAGKPAQVRLRLPEKATRAVETNLMEKEERPLSLTGNGRELVIPTGPYEIKTMKVTFATAKPGSAGAADR
jgi:alpha-mannosidase